MFLSESFRTPLQQIWPLFLVKAFEGVFLSLSTLNFHRTAETPSKEHPFFPGKSHKCLTRFGANSLGKAWEKGQSSHVKVILSFEQWKKGPGCLMYVGNYTNLNNQDSMESKAVFFLGSIVIIFIKKIELPLWTLKGYRSFLKCWWYPQLKRLRDPASMAYSGDFFAVDSMGPWDYLFFVPVGWSKWWSVITAFWC